MVRTRARLVAAAILLNAVGLWLDAPAAMPAPYALGSMAFIVVLAWYNRIVPLAVGVLFAYAGDWLLSGLLGPEESLVLPGLACFAVGYSLYSYGFGRLHLARLAPWAAVALTGWYFAVAQTDADPVMKGASFVYALILAAMPATSAGMQRVGAAILLISDLFLAARLYNKPLFDAYVPVALRSNVVWLTYVAGQALIHLNPRPRRG